MSALDRKKKAIGGALLLVVGAGVMFAGFAATSAVSSPFLRFGIVLTAGLAFVFAQCVAAAMMTSIAIENVSKPAPDSSSE